MTCFSSFALVLNGVLQDLILFPGDASFVKVPQSAWGRSYVLKFSSSDQRHFVRVMSAPLYLILTVLVVLDAGNVISLQRSTKTCFARHPYPSLWSTIYSSFASHPRHDV